MFESNFGLHKQYTQKHYNALMKIGECHSSSSPFFWHLSIVYGLVFRV